MTTNYSANEQLVERNEKCFGRQSLFEINVWSALSAKFSFHWCHMIRKTEAKNIHTKFVDCKFNWRIEKNDQKLLALCGPIARLSIGNGIRFEKISRISSVLASYCSKHKRIQTIEKWFCTVNSSVRFNHFVVSGFVCIRFHLNGQTLQPPETDILFRVIFLRAKVFRLLSTRQKNICFYFLFPFFFLWKPQYCFTLTKIYYSRAQKSTSS